MLTLKGVESDGDSRRGSVTKRFPWAARRGTAVGRAILERRIVQIRDIADGTRNHRDGARHGSGLDDRGAVAARRRANRRDRDGPPRHRRLSDSQVALLQTFAEQAVIAIGSAENYRELQERTAALAARNSEYGERIEQQSATIDVLKVMSASPGDTQPVFELIVERARAFCNADHANLALVMATCCMSRRTPG